MLCLPILYMSMYWAVSLVIVIGFFGVAPAASLPVSPGMLHTQDSVDLADQNQNPDLAGEEDFYPDEEDEAGDTGPAGRDAELRPLSKPAYGQKRYPDGLVHRVTNRTIVDNSSITVPASLPQSFDWRKNGGDYTTPPKDQGEECGGCWAYAAIGILESHWKIAHHTPSLPLDLSEQYLISCDQEDEGCEGGDFETAMPYLVDTPGPDGKVGTVNESVYPHDKYSDSCSVISPDAVRYHAGTWAYVNSSARDDPETAIPPVDELKAAIYLKGPIAGGIDDDDTFDEYSGGIFSSDNPAPEETTNHAVMLVGWGTEQGQEYFIGKNSFGTEWGENGWFRVAVNSSRIGEGAVYLDEE